MKYPNKRFCPALIRNLEVELKLLRFVKNLQDGNVYIYKSGAHYTLVEGYPKTLKEELSIEGHVDAALMCPNEHTVHIIQGKFAD